jgi:hypothetical protein
VPRYLFSAALIDIHQAQIAALKPGPSRPSRCPTRGKLIWVRAFTEQSPESDLGSSEFGPDDSPIIPETDELQAWKPPLLHSRVELSFD